MPLSSLKKPLENLEDAGEDLSGNPELVDKINEIWGELIDELDFHNMNIRKDKY